MALGEAVADCGNRGRRGLTLALGEGEGRQGEVMAAMALGEAMADFGNRGRRGEQQD